MRNEKIIEEVMSQHFKIKDDYTYDNVADAMDNYSDRLFKTQQHKMITEPGGKLTFEEALENLINTYSEENGSDTPDFILANYMFECLQNFNYAVRKRDKHYQFEPKKQNEIT